MSTHGNNLPINQMTRTICPEKVAATGFAREPSLTIINGNLTAVLSLCVERGVVQKATGTGAVNF